MEYKTPNRGQPMESYRIVTPADPTSHKFPYLETLRALYGRSFDSTIHSNDFLDQLVTARNRGWILFLIDGLGIHNLRGLSPQSFSAWKQYTTRALFPSTTASYMSSIHSCEPSQVHGVTGWWSYNSRLEYSYAPLTGRERERGAWINRLGHDPKQDMGARSAVDQHQRWDYRWFMPSKISGKNTFSQWSTEGRDVNIGYRSIKQLVERFKHHQRTAKTPPRWIVYFPQFDTSCHHHGWNSEESRSTLLHIESAIDALLTVVRRDIPVFLSADHGIIDIDDKNKYPLDVEDPIMDYLSIGPYGEARLPLFRVPNDKKKPFTQRWRESQFSEHFTLLDPKEAQTQGFFGQYPWSKAARNNWDCYIALPVTPSIIEYGTQAFPPPKHIGYHGGPSHWEMEVPFFYLPS